MIATEPQVDFTSIKSRQQATWSSGDYAVIGTTLSITGELLCEALDLRAGQRVLDVAAGNGNATLAAARRFASVTSSDYVPALLDRGRARAEAERFDITFRQADAEALPFSDGSFDVVLSIFGVMFTPDQERAAAEMVEVVEPDGTVVEVVSRERMRAERLRLRANRQPPVHGDLAGRSRARARDGQRGCSPCWRRRKSSTSCWARSLA